MTPTPRPKIEDSFIAGRACAICGANALAVKRLAGYPDHVACGRCASVFVLEGDGERVMYGKIPPEYAATRRFALKQWVWLEAVDRRAAQERRSVAPPAAPPTPAPKLLRFSGPGMAPVPPPARPATSPPPALPAVPPAWPAAGPPPAVRAVPPARPAAGPPLAVPGAPPTPKPSPAAAPQAAAPSPPAVLEVSEPPAGERDRGGAGGGGAGAPAPVGGRP